MKVKLYTLAYAAVVGTVCAVLLTVVGNLTRDRREANAEAERVYNILEVLKVPFPPKATAKELLAVHERTVRVETRGEMTVHVFAEEGAPENILAVALPLEGQGVWGPIKGFLALESDMKTIRGVAFHEQEETPGLGGEIASEWFRDQFKGKSIQDGSGDSPGMRFVRGGAASAQNEVDAITGATMTTKKVAAILNSAITQFVKEWGSDG